MSDDSEDQEDQEDVDLLHLQAAYPEAAAIFSWTPRELGHARDEALVALDTNSLVIPYNTSQKTLAEIGRVYQVLVEEKRLVVPGQVAREFAGARMTRLTEMRQNLGRKLSAVPSLEIGTYPILRELPEYAQVVDLERAAREVFDKYKNSIKAIIEQVDRWGGTDPVTDLYRKLFPPSVVVDLDDLDPEELRTERDRRARNKVPPGYKDQGKRDGGIGDLLIWQTILKVGAERKKDVVFVTSDDKSDWWHRSEGRAIYPRRELVEEFRRASDGRTLYMLSLPRLLDLFDVSQMVVEEVTAAESPRKALRIGAQAIGLQDGEILVVRHRGKYAALQAIQQTSSENGGSIRYRWWRPPDGSFDFSGPLDRGGGMASEETSNSPIVRIGELRLEWSSDRDGHGWVYFGPPDHWSSEYELALADAGDIRMVDVASLVFYAYDV